MNRKLVFQVWMKSENCRNDKRSDLETRTYLVIIAINFVLFFATKLFGADRMAVI